MNTPHIQLFREQTTAPEFDHPRPERLVNGNPQRTTWNHFTNRSGEVFAVVIGGTSLMGGRGSVISTFFGVLIISVLAAGLAQIGATEPTKRIITGAVIVMAVVLDTYRSQRARRRN